MPPHRIHLKGPWNCAWKEGTFDETNGRPQIGTVTMPREWRAIFGKSRGCAQFKRKFHRPSNLESHERVMLVLTEVRGQGSIQLNQHQLGAFGGIGDRIEFEITSLMNSFNELTIDIEFDPHAENNLAGGLYGPVALDIYSARGRD
jgi:hypothetical protein